MQLPSGARLLVKRDPSVRLVAMRAVWMGGLRYEDARTNGVNNLLAALVTRGTRTRTGDELAHEIEAMAGSIGGFSGRNSFGLRGEMLARHWERGLELFADCILDPAFADDELEKERRQALEEIRTQADNISSEAFRLFQQTLYRQHPYRLDVIGTADSVRRPDAAPRSADYYKRHMAAVADDPRRRRRRRSARGRQAGARAVRRGRQGGAAAGGRRPLPWDARAPDASGSEVFKFQNKQQAHVVYGFPGTTITDPRSLRARGAGDDPVGAGRAPLRRAARQARPGLPRERVLRRGRRPRLLRGLHRHLAGEPRRWRAPASRSELAKIAAVPVPKAELERAKRYLVGAHEISLQRRAAVASTLAFHEAYGVGWDEYRRYAPGILAVGAADVQRVAQEVPRARARHHRHRQAGGGGAGAGPGPRRSAPPPRPPGAGGNRTRR